MVSQAVANFSDGRGEAAGWNRQHSIVVLELVQHLPDGSIR